MAEINYNELFGLDPAEGAEVQEVAEPVAEEEPEGAEEQEVAEPADEPADEAEDENAKYAAARRKAEAERDAAVSKAKADADAAAKKSVEDMLASLDIEDPYTGSKITTQEQFEAYRRRNEEEKRNQMLRQMGVNDDTYSEFINTLPEVKAAREALAKADNERAQARLNEDVNKISALDPSIKSLDDLFALPNYADIRANVAKGNSLYDAYRLANYDKLIERTAIASKQAARNSAASKSHLTPTAQRGTGGVDVPSDVVAQYKLFNPDATAEEIRTHYERYKR